MPDPMWRQIAEDLRQKIEARELGGDGRPLPSEIELRDEYNASRNTIRDAVKWLVIRGLLVTRPGHGTFVVKKIDPFVTTLSTEIGAGPESERAAYLSEVEKRLRESRGLGPPGRDPSGLWPRRCRTRPVRGGQCGQPSPGTIH